MIRKATLSPKIFGFLLLVLLLRAITAQLIFAVGLFCSDKHIKNGLNCNDCHETVNVVVGAKVGKTKCLSCHGSYEELAKRTSKIRLNPHVDYHLGELDCNVCHHGHRLDENHCVSCHKEGH
jgi:hypothetical protein